MRWSPLRILRREIERMSEVNNDMEHLINAKGISNINAAAIVSGIGDKRQFIQL
jgi:hypothetical protein